jgi:hypothetical protein
MSFSDVSDVTSEVIIANINRTLDAAYCTSLDCEEGIGGNYSYSVPLSSVFPLAFIAVEFP